MRRISHFPAGLLPSLRPGGLDAFVDAHLYGDRRNNRADRGRFCRRNAARPILDDGPPASR